VLMKKSYLESPLSRTPSLIQNESAERKEPVMIPDNFEFGLDDMMVPLHYRDSLENIMIPHGLVQDRIDKLAHDIRKTYSNITVHMLCVLKGGSIFFSDLLRALRTFHDFNDQSYVPFTFDFIRVKSYEGTESTGNVQISGGDVSRLQGRHVLLVEDIIDTGLTMQKLVPAMKAHGLASVRVASLLEKRTERSCGFKADFVGFSIPDKFVVGYCMDYNEWYRDLRHIAVINQAGIEKFKDEL